MVIEEVQDLGVSPVGEGPVREVRLPGFVGLVGFEAVQGRFGALLWFGGDEPGGVEDPADRGGRVRMQSFTFEVPGDRDGSGVQAGSDQFTAQVQDPLHCGFGGAARIVQGAFRPGLDGVNAAFCFAPEEFMDPATADSEAAGCGRDGQALVTDGEDDDFLLRHESCSTNHSVNDVPSHR